MNAQMLDVNSQVPVVLNWGMSGPTSDLGIATLPPAAQRRAQWVPTADETATLCRDLAHNLRHLELARQQIAALRLNVARLTKVAAHDRQFAYNDELTGLANRRLLLDRFHQARARGARNNRQLALLFLDLDGFKGINDAHGHGVGDELLRQVGARLVACSRASDSVCRYGGDEFVVLLAEIAGRENAIVAQRKIRACLGRPFLLDTGTFQLAGSIGVAVYPGDGGSFHELIARADRTMYEDKARGRTA
jgi:diguanylate cyclase (GGDEF)-like protein